MPKNNIFVQIASYKDPQLIPTLKNLIQNSTHPENLNICICWQYADEDTIEDFLDEQFDLIDCDVAKDIVNLKYKKANIKLLKVHYLNTHGACWARNKIQQHYNNEKYTLQLDSHHRFIKSWDVELIKMLESLRTVSKKPILTAYIPSFDPENDPAGRAQEPWKMDFDRFIPEGAVFFMPSTMDDWKTRTLPMRARFYSAHFAFADGSFAVEVQHDPEYFFHGEEISIGVRAFTHGYDLYHPHKVIAWHEYTRKNRTKVWDDHTTPQKLKGNIKLDWVERNKLCHERNRILFGTNGENSKSIDFGKYGFGTERTLRDFEEYAGMSFKYNGIQQHVLDKKEPEPFTKSSTIKNEDDWKASFVRSNDLRILVHKNEITKFEDNTVTDFDFWYVGAHDIDNVEIFRKDKVEQEINQLLKGEWSDFRLIYLSNKIATTYTVWPHSKSKGWLNKIVKTVNNDY